MRRTRIELVPNAWKAFMLTTTPAPLSACGQSAYSNIYIIYCLFVNVEYVNAQRDA